MGPKVVALLIVAFLLSASGFAQEKSKKQLKEEKKTEKQKQVEAMLNAKDFVFLARTAMPQGYKTVNLTSGSYTVKFKPDYINCYLPFYGRAYSGAAYGGDDGMKFEGKPDEFTVAKGKKNYQLNAVVKGERDTYRISATVSYSGSASLIITSNNRSTISYNGDISGHETPVEK